MSLFSLVANLFHVTFIEPTQGSTGSDPTFTTIAAMKMACDQVGPGVGGAIVGLVVGLSVGAIVVVIVLIWSQQKKLKLVQKKLVLMRKCS